MKTAFVVLLCLCIGGLAYTEDVECPAYCSCSEEDIGPYMARCSKLVPEQKFGGKVSRLVIENNQNLVLSKNIFETVGLQSVSTIRIVNCTIQSLYSRVFSGLALTTVEFESNKQLTIDPDSFNTTNLMQLVFRNNIVKFSKKVDYFFDCPELREFVFSGAELTELPSKAFSKFPKVQFIDLSSNHLQNLGSEFVSLKDLEEVDLSNNNIDEIGISVFENNEFDVLKLKNNPIKTLAGVQLPFLTELDVSYCKFSSIDKSTFSGLSALRFLNLSGNSIQDIAEDAFSDRNMSNLASIDLSHNNLKGPLPKTLFRKSEGLEGVTLSNNPSLQVLDKDFFLGLDNIFRLEMSNCGFKTLDDSLFRDLVKLSILNLSGNLIQRLKPGVLNKYITRLDLSQNLISHLDDIKFPSNSRLRKLFLSGNKLTFISTSSLSDLTKLEYLDLSSCSLTSFWDLGDKFPVLHSLNTLSVANNLIPVITQEQLKLTPNLEDIDLRNNSLICDEIFLDSLKWLKRNKVKPYIIQRNPVLTRHPDSNSENISPLGWGDIQEELCGPRERERLLPIEEDKNEKVNVDEDEGSDDDYDEDGYEDDDQTRGLADDADRIVIRKHTILQGESNDNDLGYFLMVLFSVVTILVSLVIIAAFVLRWSRQRNSYGARMISTHLHHPKMKRDRSSIYQQLFEDPNHPTTPVMSIKNSNQTCYNFPDAQGNKQFGYITYLSKEFNDTTVIPEPV